MSNSYELLEKEHVMQEVPRWPKCNACFFFDCCFLKKRGRLIFGPLRININFFCLQPVEINDVFNFVKRNYDFLIGKIGRLIFGLIRYVRTTLGVI
jgi:hypothetical protein